MIPIPSGWHSKKQQRSCKYLIYLLNLLILLDWVVLFQKLLIVLVAWKSNHLYSPVAPTVATFVKLAFQPSVSRRWTTHPSCCMIMMNFCKRMFTWKELNTIKKSYQLLQMFSYFHCLIVYYCWFDGVKLNIILKWLIYIY